MDINNGIIHLWDLPQKIIYVDLEENYKQFILSKCKEIAGTWIALGKQLGFKINHKNKCKTLEGIREGKKIRLDVLFSILKYLKQNGIKMELNELESKIKVISVRKGSSFKLANSIINPNLPFNFNSIEGATLLSALLHDGGINSNFNPHYSNKNLELRRKVHKTFNTVFGKFIGRNSNPDNHQQIYFPKVTGIILVDCLGMKKGRKTKNNPNIPSFIFDSSEEIKAAFLQQTFDDEGWIHKTYIGLKLAVNIPNPSNELISEIKSTNPIEYSPKLLLDNKRLLDDLGINSSQPQFREIYYTKNGTCGSKWEILLNGKENLTSFKERINFSTLNHKTKLEKLVSSLHQVYPKGKAQTIILSACRKLQMNLGYITSRDLSEEINRGQVRAKKAIQEFVKRGILKTKTPRHGRSGAKYVFT